MVSSLPKVIRPRWSMTRGLWKLISAKSSHVAPMRIGSMSDLLLKVEGVCAGYDQVRVLWGIDITVEAGEIACLIGSNGAGKTTLLRVLSGLVPALEGRITFRGEDITRL